MDYKKIQILEKCMHICRSQPMFSEFNFMLCHSNSNVRVLPSKAHGACCILLATMCRNEKCLIIILSENLKMLLIC